MMREAGRQTAAEEAAAVTSAWSYNLLDGNNSNSQSSINPIFFLGSH